MSEIGARGAPDQSLLYQALELIEAALAQLDKADSPGDIGCHLDLARCRLIDTIEASLRTGEDDAG